MRNAELLLAALCQGRLWPIVSLAPDPAQHVSLLHGPPVTPSRSPQHQPPAFLWNGRVTEWHLCLIPPHARSKGGRDLPTPSCAPCLCFSTFLSLISVSRKLFSFIKQDGSCVTEIKAPNKENLPTPAAPLLVSFCFHGPSATMMLAMERP